MIRFFDLIFASIAIVLFSPLLIPILILLLLTGEHKIFFKQTRVGRKGHHFSLLKFATMLENSPNLPGGDITSGNDPRVLPFREVPQKNKNKRNATIIKCIVRRYKYCWSSSIDA